MAGEQLGPGAVVWSYLEPVRGREQGGRRPVVIVSTQAYLDVVDTLAIVVPLTRTDRGWPNHPALTGIEGLDPCFAMTEQPRTLSRERLGPGIGVVSPECLQEMRLWLSEFIVG